MYPVMQSNYEKPPWEFCDRRGLFALDCRTDRHWDDIAGRYGPCLLCLDLLFGKHQEVPNQRDSQGPAQVPAKTRGKSKKGGKWGETRGTRRRLAGKIFG